MSLFNFNESGNASIDNQNAVSFSFFLFLKKKFQFNEKASKSFIQRYFPLQIGRAKRILVTFMAVMEALRLVPDPHHLIGISLLCTHSVTSLTAIFLTAP